MASGNSPSTFHTALLCATHRLLLTFTVNPGPPAAGMMYESWHTHTHVTAWLWVHSNEGTHCRPKTCPRRVPHSPAPMQGSGMWVWGVFCDGILQNTLAESLPFQPWPGVHSRDPRLIGWLPPEGGCCSGHTQARQSGRKEATVRGPVEAGTGAQSRCMN